jgi:hypothetical protein
MHPRQFPFRKAAAVSVLAVLMCACQQTPDTVITRAAARGDCATVSSELACGVSPNQVDSSGMTPLAYAASEGNLEMMRLLLDLGASPNLPAGHHHWPPILHAVHKDRAAAVRLLVEHGADVNATTKTAFTPLMMAAVYGNAEMVKLLLSVGADPNLKSRTGATALTLAVGGSTDIGRFTMGNCQTETVRSLLEAAPDLRLAGAAADREAAWIARLGGCDDVLILAEVGSKTIAER